MERGCFVMKGYGLGELNQYWCSQCKEAGIEHEVVDVPSVPTERSSSWGIGVPTHMRQCTNCKRQDGPWVYASHVGEGW